jgi:hypothetical protein
MSSFGRGPLRAMVGTRKTAEMIAMIAITTLM